MARHKTATSGEHASSPPRATITSRLRFIWRAYARDRIKRSRKQPHRTHAQLASPLGHYSSGALGLAKTRCLSSRGAPPSRVREFDSMPSPPTECSYQPLPSSSVLEGPLDRMLPARSSGRHRNDPLAPWAAAEALDPRSTPERSCIARLLAADARSPFRSPLALPRAR